MEKVQKTYFSAELAEKSVPMLTKQITRLRKLQKAIAFLSSLEIQHADELDDFYTSVTVNHDFHKISQEFYQELKSLVRQGFLVKDLERGYVDMYAKHNGKEIFLCWKFGERKVRYWHNVYNGFKDRKPLSFLGSQFTGE